MPSPLGKPIMPPSRDGRVAHLTRRVDKLERRAVGRWVYVSGIAVSNDSSGIDAPSWTDPDLGGGIFGWQNGWADTGSATLGADGLTRYRIGASGLEMAINATGGSSGTIMFTLIADFWDQRDGKQTFTGADDTGQFTCYTIVPRTDKPQCADVYAGRV